MTSTTELILKAQGGDREALSALVAANQGLIGMAVKRYAAGIPSGMIDKDDLFQVGNVALMNAIARHDANLGALSTFSYHCICNAIVKARLDAQPGRPKRDPNRPRFNSIGVDFQFADEAIEPPTEEKLSPELKRRMIESALRSAGKDAHLLRDYYLGDMTLEEVGDLHGLSKERVRQRLIRAVENARKVFHRAKTFREFLAPKVREAKKRRQRKAVAA